MTYEKEKYEQLISQSPLFSLDKETQPDIYRNESLKMVDYLYNYLLLVNKERYERFGCEIVDVAKRCINGYDGSGDFLHYFLAAWKQEYRHIYANQCLEEQFCGMKFPEPKKREVKKYLSYSGKYHNLPESEAYEKIALAMSVSVDRVKEIATEAERTVLELLFKIHREKNFAYGNR